MRRRCAILTNDDGSVVVEFAVVLALVLLSAVAAMMLVGSQSERTFALLGHREWTETPALANDRNTDADASDGSRVKTFAQPLPTGGRDLVTLNQQTLTAMIAAFRCCATW